MPKLTNKPFVPFGLYTDKSKANEAAKQMPYPCKVVPNKNGSYSLLRQA